MTDQTTDEKNEVMALANRIDSVLSAAKKLKSSYKKYNDNLDAQEENFSRSKGVSVKAHELLSEIVDCPVEEKERYTKLQEEYANAQKELNKINNKVDKSIDKGHDLWERVAVSHNNLMGLIDGSIQPQPPQVDAAESDQSSDAAEFDQSSEFDEADSNSY